jgi:hypothetical protein
MPLISDDHFPIVRVFFHPPHFGLKIKIGVFHLVLVGVGEVVVRPEFRFDLLDCRTEETRIIGCQAVFLPVPKLKRL